MAFGRPDQRACDLVQRLVPRDRRKGGTAHPLVADPAEGLAEPVGVMLALRIARDLGADHARRIVVGAGAVNPADRPRIEPLHLERAGRRAIMGTDRGKRVERHVSGVALRLGRRGFAVFTTTYVADGPSATSRAAMDVGVRCVAIA